MEVPDESWKLRWDLLGMAALRGAAEAANDDDCDPERGDSVYEARGELEEPEAGVRGGLCGPWE